MRAQKKFIFFSCEIFRFASEIKKETKIEKRNQSDAEKIKTADDAKKYK